MFFDYLARGAKAGAVGGLLYGLFVAVVGNNFVAGLETFESGHADGGAAVAWSTAGFSVVAGVFWGLLFGLVVFGIAYYFLEPALPGDATTRSGVLAAGGFLTVSGAPWLVLPPQPPGVEQALATDARLAWYAGMMVAGALAFGLAILAYRRVSVRDRRLALVAATLPFALLAVPVALAPANPVHGSVPPALVAAFRWTTVAGQLLLWATLAVAHVRFGSTAETERVAVDPRAAD
ncbi:MAG: CbtA family protein [Haloarculaceae archaeon]